MSGFCYKTLIVIWSLTQLVSIPILGIPQKNVLTKLKTRCHSDLQVHRNHSDKTNTNKGSLGKGKWSYRTESAIGHGKIEVMGKRTKRSVNSAQIIQSYRRNPEENLMIGLTEDFSKMKNMSRITACLPIPKAAGEPIEWEIITFPLPETNKTVACQEKETIKNVTVTEYQKEGVLGASITESLCKEKLNTQFTTYEEGIGKCIYDKEIKIIQQIREKTWECQEKNNSQETWDTIWSVGILQKFQYGGETPWCLRWTRKQSLTEDMSSYRASRNRTESVPWWNCTKVLDCDTDPETITMPPVRTALMAGCACRGLKVGGEIIKAPIRTPYLVNCRYSTVHSMGHLVWATSDGTWTTHLSMEGPVREITLGLPTLCPIWKKSPFRGKLETLQI
ncbi:uncharacterized protein LOC134164094 [Pezoporus occidentalis]|uniref:uncharacterized protein LOC134164094 n=1 Tax=Pezoporus occidentalis TaxID=407982 RepID=UPI002F90B435